jgi:hypothetical protein
VNERKRIAAISKHGKAVQKPPAAFCGLHDVPEAIPACQPIAPEGYYARAVGAKTAPVKACCLPIGSVLVEDELGERLDVFLAAGHQYRHLRDGLDLKR